MRIPADGITVPSAALHFTTFGVLSQTQQVSLGDRAVSVTGRCS